jgi:CxxC-x17-CxxC domain-containing protein
LIVLELHKVKTGKKKFGGSIPPNSNSPSKSFRNSRDDRGSRYSRDDRREESTTVTCSDCGTECKVPFVPRTDRPVYCSDCFRQNKPQDSGNDRYSRDDRGSRYSRDDRGSRYSRDDRGSRYSRDDRGSRSSRDDFRSKKPKTDKFLKKQETLYSGGSEKFYNTIKEKLFEILGGKVCSGCGFKDERALGFSHISDEDTFDNVQRGGFASSWGKYISDPDLARNELKILCLNCNELKKPVSTPERKTSGSSKKKKRFPR